MIWLTRVTIPQRDAFALGLTNCYAWHQLSWDCFQSCPDAQRDFLLRVDPRPEEGCMRMFLLSQRQPVRPDKLVPQWWAAKPVRDDFLSFQTYRFSLKANPTRLKTVGGRKIRQAVLERSDQVEWLLRKAEQSGFAVPNPEQVRIEPSGEHRIRCRQNTALCIGFNFEGILSVTDREKFTRAFVSGIGKSKAFGFGMLMISPIL